MNYPLLSEYVESIRSTEDNLAELNHLHPVLDANGDPVMTGGNFAVVFKMQDKNTGKYYALKCFTRDQDGRAESYKMIAEELDSVDSSYITHFKYFDKELFVDTANSDETEYPVLQMDWVEGKTLDKYIRENINDQYALEMLAYQFSRLAMWLLPQPFAHGDLKPDNIIVHEDGTLTLVDYDGMYVPAMKGQRARELGSPDFRHPSRTADEFNEHIDDFPIASILLSLKAIALQPSLLEEYGAKDRLLLSSNDYSSLSLSNAILGMHQLMGDYGFAKAYSLFLLAFSQNKLLKDDYHLVKLDLFPEVACDYALKLSKKGYMEEAFDIWSQLAQRGIARAACNVGWCYYRGQGVERNKEEAIKWLTIAIQNNYSRAYTNLGKIYHKSDKNKSFSLFLKASNLNDESAKFFIGYYYEKGFVVPKNVAKAFECYNASAELGCSRAQRKLGDVYKDGLLGQDKSLLKSFQWYYKAAEQGDSTAQFNIGYYYYAGQGIEKNAYKAVEWYLRASVQNNLAALNNLGVCYEHGDGVDIDLSKAFSYYKKSAIQGNVVAQRNLSNCYLNGIGIAQNLEEAFGWRLKAANNKDVSSQKKVAEWYFKGFGVEKDNEQALVWFTKSKLQGDKNDIVVDSEIAIDSLIRLANDGDVPAQYFVGKCYEYGVGVKKDINEARKWFERAMGNGYVEAYIKLKIINEINTSVSDEEKRDAIKDEFGIYYSKDYKKAIGCNSYKRDVYSIKQGTRVICDFSFEDSHYSVLGKIIIPSSIVSIGNNPFAYPSSWHTLNAVIIENKSKSFKIVNDALLTKDGKRLICYFGSNKKSYKIPQCVEIIGDSSFKGNKDIEKITFPPLLKQIEDKAFMECLNLKVLDLPESTIRVGEKAFYGCESLVKIISLGSIDCIEEKCFMGCNLSSVSLPYSLKEIKEDAFNSNSTLKEIVLPNGVLKIGNNAFAYCGLNSVTLNEELREIEDLCFFGCPISTLSIPSHVRTIGINPFVNTKCIVCECNNYFKTYKDCLINIKDKSLISYFGNTSFEIPQSINLIKEFAFTRSNISMIKIGENVKAIGEYAFSECHDLEYIEWEKISIKSIPEGMFYECKNLCEVIIPKSVREISKGVFTGCERLTHIYFKMDEVKHKDLFYAISHYDYAAQHYRSSRVHRCIAYNDSLYYDLNSLQKLFIVAPKGCAFYNDLSGFHSIDDLSWDERNIVIVDDSNI